MTAKGSPAYYAQRRQRPTPAPAPAKTTTVRCSSEACGMSYLSYHPKCPFCGAAPLTERATT